MFDLIYQKWPSGIKKEVDKKLILVNARGRLEGALLIFDLWILSHLLSYL